MRWASSHALSNASTLSSSRMPRSTTTAAWLLRVSSKLGSRFCSQNLSSFPAAVAWNVKVMCSIEE